MFRNNQKQQRPKTDNTLETMLSFNHDQPIKEEVIFEDSDDEETRQLEIYIKQELCDANIHAENILIVGAARSLASKLEVPDNNRDLLNNDECSVSVKIEKPDIYEDHKLNTECRIESNVQDETDNVVAFSFEQIDEIITSSEEENVTNTPTNKRKSPEVDRLEEIIKDILTKQSKAKQDTATAIETNHESASVPEWPVQNSFESCTSLPKADNKMPNSNAISTSSEDKFLKKKEPPSYTTALYASFLHTIIENLFMILPALNDYVRSVNHTEEYRLHSKTRFEAVKYQYFSFCYSTVKTIILPHKEDKDFLNSFKKRLKIYADQRGMKTSDHNINLLCDELVCWAEVQRNNISFQEILARKKQQSQNNTNKSSEIQTLLEKPWQPPPAKRNRPCPVPNTYDLSCINEASFKNIRENINNITLATNEQTQSIPTYPQADHRLQNNCAKDVIQYQTFQDMHKSSLEETVTFAPATQHPGKRRLGKLPSYGEGLRSPSQMCQNINRNCNPNTHQMMNPLQHYGSHEPPSIRAQERSISRDSGYLSPIGQHFLQNEFSTSAVPEETQENRFPVIVEVNSMQQPNATKPNINGGYCRTCNKYTHLLCMGCNFVYYCSTECQSLHWKIHKFYCRSC